MNGIRKRRRRVLAAEAAGNAPDPADLAVLQGLLDSGPMSAAAVDVGALMDNLHGVTAQERRSAK